MVSFHPASKAIFRNALKSQYVCKYIPSEEKMLAVVLLSLTAE
jgi:hypothetical protein